jgi:CBS domain-containing protein
LKVKEYMKRDFRTVQPEASLREIARLFYETGESVLPVTERDGTLDGVIAIENFVLIFLPNYIDLIKSLDFVHDLGALEKISFTVEELLFVAEDLMTEDVPVLDGEDSIMKAAAVLHKKQLSRIPVVSGGRLVGMISMNDVCRAIYDLEGSR